MRKPPERLGRTVCRHYLILNYDGISVVCDEHTALGTLHVRAICRIVVYNSVSTLIAQIVRIALEVSYVIRAHLTVWKVAIVADEDKVVLPLAAVTVIVIFCNSVFGI